MEVLKTDTDFHWKMKEILDQNPLFVAASSFGIYAGLSKNKDWHQLGGKFKSPIRRFLDEVNRRKIPAYLIIGPTIGEECSVDCPHCAERNNLRRLSLIQHVEQFPNIEILIVDKWHAKMVFTEKSAIIGGRNLSSSDWNDLSFYTEDPSVISELNEYFFTQWNNLKGNKFREVTLDRKEVEDAITSLST